MKKIICFVLCVIFCLAIAGCSDNKIDASEIYTAAKEKTDSLSSFDAVMQMSLEYDEEDLERGNESNVHIQLDRRDENAPIYYKVYNINDVSLGQKYTTSTYYADNVVYEMSGIGEKYKTMVAVESIMGSFESVAIELPPEIFEASEVDGNKVSTEADASAISGLLESFMAGTPAYYTSVKEDGSFDYEYSEVEVDFSTNNEGYFEYISLECTVDFDHAGGEGSADISMTVTYNDPGKDVEITPPDDLSEYTWYEESEKTQEELEGEMMNEILALFIFDNGTATRVENFDELYLVACSKYGKETVDMYVETVEMFGSVKN